MWDCPGEKGTDCGPNPGDEEGKHCDVTLGAMKDPGPSPAHNPCRPSQHSMLHPSDLPSPPLPAPTAPTALPADGYSLGSYSSSHMGRSPKASSLHQGSCQDSPAEVGKAAPVGAHQPCGEPVGHAAPAVSPSIPLAPPTEGPPSRDLSPSPTTLSVPVSDASRSPLKALQPPEPLLPLASTSPGPLAPAPFTSRLPDPEAHPPPLTASSGPPQPDPTLPLPRCAPMALPLDTVPQSLSPNTPWSATPITAITGPGDSSCQTLTLSKEQTAAIGLDPANSSQCESQQEHLPHHAPAAPLGEDPTDKPVGAGSLFLLRSDDQHLLEVQITKIPEEKEDPSYLNPMSPDYPLTPPGNELKSLGAEPDSDTPQPSWGTQGKSEQLSGLQPLPHSDVSGDHLQQSSDQLFSGLPTVHSESQVVPDCISENASTPPSPSFLLNGTPRADPFQVQAEASPPLPTSQPPSPPEFQSQPVTSTTPQFQAPSPSEVQAQAPVQPSLPDLPSSPPHIGACEVPCPTAQKEPQSLIPDESHHPQWPLLQKQLESGQASSFVDKRPQEVFSSITSDLPKDRGLVSTLPENFRISPEFRNQLEQHLQKGLIRYPSQSPHKTKESLGPACLSSLTCDSSKNAQEVRSQLRDSVGEGLGRVLGKIQEDLPNSSKSCLVTSEKSEHDLILLRSDSQSDMLRHLSKDLENLLKVHMDRKWGQISKGWIPLRVRRSWIAVNHTPAKSGSHIEARNQGTLKCREPQVNTTDTRPFLIVNTRDVLEAHIMRFGVRHKWGFPLKGLKPIQYLGSKQTQPSPTEQTPSALSAACAPGPHSKAEFAECLGKPPQAPLGEKVKPEEAGPSQASPLLAPSPVCEEIQRAQEGTPPGEDHGPSKASLIREEDRSPCQSPPLTWRNGTMDWAERDSRLKPNSSSAMARNQPKGKSGGHASQDPYRRVIMHETNLGSQPLRDKEATEAVPNLVLGTNVPTQSENMNSRSSGDRGSSHSPQHPGEPDLNADRNSKLKAKGKVQSENQPQDCPTRKPLPADNEASHVPLDHCKRVHTGAGAASKGLSVLMAAERNSLGQQEPRSSKFQDSGDHQGPSYTREHCRPHDAQESATGLEQLGTPQAGSMNPSAQPRGAAGSVGRKSLWQLPEKKHDPPGTFLSRLKIPEENEDPSYPNPIGPAYPLTSPGNVLKSLGDNPDSDTPQPSWGTQGKSDQLPGAQPLPHSEVSGDHLQQSSDQLFSGLPTVHSESRVVPDCISENASTPPSPSFLLNGTPRAGPFQVQAEASPPLPTSQPPSPPEFQSQPVTSTTPQFQAPSPSEVQAQAPVQPSLPDLPSSPPHIGACEVPCPMAQKEPQSLIPDESHHPQWPLLQKQLESGRASSFVDKRPQEAFSSITSDLPKHRGLVSTLPENFRIRPEFRNQLEQHLQKGLVRYPSQSPHKTKESLGPACLSSLTRDSSKNAQEVGSQLRDGVGEGLGRVLGKVQEDLPNSSESSLVMSEKSERDLILLRSDSQSDMLRHLSKDSENLLKVHMDRKWGQISKGWIPLRVRRSWIAVNHTPAKSGSHMEARNQGTLKGGEPQVNTTDTRPFLIINTRDVLEAHFMRFGVRHKWGLPLKGLKPIQHLRSKETQPSPTEQTPSALSAACAPGPHSKAEFSECLGKPPQAPPGEKVKPEEAGPSQARPLLAPSPVCEEIQRAQEGTPPGEDHGPSKASLIREEGRSPCQSPPLTWRNGTMDWVERDSRLKPNSSSAMAGNQAKGKSGGHASQDPYRRVIMHETNLGSQPLRAKEAREAVPNVVLGTNVPTQSENMNSRSSGARGTSHSPQHPGEPDLIADRNSKLKAGGKIQSENQPQDCPTRKPLPADNGASHVPLDHCKRVPTRAGATSKGLSGLMAVKRSSLRQQEPRSSKLQDSGDHQGPSYTREHCRPHDAQERATGLEQLGTPQAGNMNPSAQARGAAGSVGRKSLWQLPEKKHDSPGTFLSRLKLFLQGVPPTKPAKNNEDLQNCTPKPVTAQTQGPVKSSSVLASKNAEGQALMTTVGRILMEKVTTYHGRGAQNLNEHKQGPQTPVCGDICYHRLPFYPEQGVMTGHTACSHQANSNDQRGLSHFKSLPPKKTGCPASPCHYGPKMPSSPGHHQHRPGHCHVRGGTLRGQR